MKTNTALRTLQVGAALAALVGGAVMFAQSATAKEGHEKCAGVVKKGMNDCAANGHSCAGQAAKDSDPNEWIYVPTGTCKKIAGGTVKG